MWEICNQICSFRVCPDLGGTLELYLSTETLNYHYFCIIALMSDRSRKKMLLYVTLENSKLRQTNTDVILNS